VHYSRLPIIRGESLRRRECLHSVQLEELTDNQNSSSRQIRSNATMKEAEPLMFSAQFCTHFKAFVDNITADCKELRNISNSAAEVNTYDEEFSEDMIEELQDKIDHLERQTTTLCSYPGLRLPLSLEYLLSLSRSLVSQNATALDSLVHALNQYGYTHSTALTSHEKVNEMKTMNIAASNTDVNVSKTPLISKVSKIPKCEEDEEDGGTPRLEDIGLSELSLQLLNNNINSNAALPSKQLQFAAIESSSDEEDDDCITEESIYKRHGVSPPSTPLNQVKSLPYYTHSTPLSLNMNHITASSSHTPAAATPLTQSTVTPKITATPLISSTPVTSVTSVTSATLSAKSGTGTIIAHLQC
jgi:hypothetical protein